MQFIKRRPALKFLPFLVLGIIFGDLFPEFNLFLISLFLISFLGIFTRFLNYSIPLCIFGIGFLNHSIIHAIQEIPQEVYNTVQSFQCELISVKQKSQKVEYVFQPLDNKYGNILVHSTDSLNIFPGDEMIISGKIVKPRTSRNPGAFNYRKFLSRKNINLIMLKPQMDSIQYSSWSLNKFYFKTRKEIIHSVNKNVDSPYNHLLVGLLLGEKGELNFELLERFRTLGIIHVLAVSGLHVGFIFLILSLVAQTLRLNPFNKLLLTVFGLLFYMGLTGYPASVIRAGTLGILYSLANYKQKNADIWNILGWTAFLMLMINPNALFNIGFQLSFGAVSGIVFVMNQAQHLKDNLDLNYKSKIVRFSVNIFEGVFASIGALIGTFLPVAFHFHEMSLIGISLNIIVIPITFLLVIFGIITISTSFISRSLADIYGECVFGLGLLLDKISIFGDGLELPMLSLGGLSPFSILIIFFGLGCLFYFRNPRYFQTISIYLLFLFSAIIWQENWKEDKVYFSFLDVGQGDACLVHSDDFAILIDAGYVGFGKDYGRTVILPHLKYRGIEEIDLAIFSHPHADHIGGFDYLANKIQIHEIWDTKNNFNTKLYQKIIHKHIETGTRLKFPNPGEIYKIGNLEMTILYPDSLKAQNAPNINEASLVLRMDHGENSVLFMGDAEHDAEKIISGLKSNLESDVVKIGHHGSKTSSIPELIENTKTSFGIISLGENNKFNHPSIKIVNRWKKKNVDVFRTDYHGAITIVSDGYSLKLFTQTKM